MNKRKLNLLQKKLNKRLAGRKDRGQPILIATTYISNREYIAYIKESVMDKKARKHTTEGRPLKKHNSRKNYDPK